MKINLDYYKEELDKKEIPEEYEEILEKVNNAKGDVSLTLNQKSKIKNILALSETRENILSWYEFKKDCSILELNAHYGELTGLLCKRAKKVVSIERSKLFSEIIKKRYENTNNLELYVGELEQIELKEKFDYAIIIGVAEKLEEYLEFAKEHVNDESKIIIALNNKFGIKSWITLKEDSQVINNSKTAMSKKKIDKILSGLNTKYYYPFPDYKMANIILTQKCNPSVSIINRDLTYKDEDVNFKETEAFKEIIKEDPEKVFSYSNSFLIEASKLPIEENDIKFISFSNMRKDEYRIRTTIKDKNVYKCNVNEKSKKHIEDIKKNIDIIKKLNISTLDSYDENNIISKYCDKQTLEQILKEIIQEQETDKFIEIVKEYEDYLLNKLNKINKEKIKKDNVFTRYKIDVDNEEKIEKLNFVKYGFWDMTFSNCFVIKNEYWFYDQEWLEYNVPVEFIIYRAIKYFTQLAKYVSVDEIYEKLEIAEYLEIFEKLDDRLQENIRKALFWRIHQKDELAKNKIIKFKELKTELENQKKINEQMKKTYDELYNSYIEKNNELSILKSSLSWKITKPLRTIRGLKNKRIK